MKKFVKMLIASMLGSGLTIAVFLITGLNDKSPTGIDVNKSSTPVHNALYTVKENGEFVPLDFTGVSKNVMEEVVHIKSVKKIPVGNQYYDQSPLGDMFGDQFFRYFYGEPKQNRKERSRPHEFEQEGTGSGVIISSNGYIVTNNHVVDQADDIEVTLHNNDTYKAKVIGTDPSTDIALLQIKVDGLKAISLGNSDQVEVGQWVMAIGNPFNLNSTVTAGIVSAKGRNINIIDDKSAIEAFIQTDAAINPGNSGGALVNLEGQLIGINSAIASPTGSYAGYGFAVPSNIVSKVVEDFMKYGMVQRAYLGVMIRDINSDLMNDEHLKLSEGAYVDSLVENSAAAEAGIKAGDIIVGIDESSVLQTSDVLEHIGRHRPGDKVDVKVNRKGDEIVYHVTLANLNGTKKLVDKEDEDVFDMLGATFENLGRDQAEDLGVDGGVVVMDLKGGILKNETGIKEGFIITGINNTEITSIDDLRKALKHIKGGVMLEGMYENYPGVLFYAFGMPEK